MADSQIQLPYTATTSGDLLDASLLGAKKRERMAIGSDTSTDMAIVSTAGALSIAGPVTITSGTVTLSSNPTVNVSSGVITIGGILVTPAVAPVDAITAAYMPITTSGGGLVTVTNPIGISSGLITLTGTNVVTNASSGLVQIAGTPTVVSASSGLIQITGPVTSASSGLVQVLQSTGVWAISGTVTVGNPSTGVNIFGSSGAITPATSSGGLLVTFTNSVAGSTAINLVGSSNAIAPATSSGGLLVTFTNSVAGSTVVSLSSPIGISSGIITLTSGVILTSATLVGVIGTSGGQAVVTTSGGMLVTFTNSVAGSTNTMISGSTGSIGVVTSGGALFVGIVSSGGIYAPVTSSAGLLVNASITGGAGSTVVNLEGSTGTQLIISSGGVARNSVNSSGGIYAPVTSSGGLKVTLFSTQATFGVVQTTLGAPVTKQLTTQSITVFTIVLAATGTAGQAIGIHTATSALSTNTPVVQLASLVGTVSMNFLRGIPFPTGLFVTDALGIGTTGTNTSAVAVTVEYEV